jgi:hypothetical protein
MNTSKQTQDGEAIRRRAAIAIASVPHDDIDYYIPLENGEVCAVMSDSLTLLASLRDVPMRPIPSASILDSSRNDGRTIRLRTARALAEASYPHAGETEPWEQCEACAILSESLALLASLNGGAK